MFEYDGTLAETCPGDQSLHGWECCGDSVSTECPLKLKEMMEVE